jgi:hypothetical protein
MIFLLNCHVFVSLAVLLLISISGELPFFSFVNDHWNHFRKIQSQEWKHCNIQQVAWENGSRCPSSSPSPNAKPEDFPNPPPPVGTWFKPSRLACAHTIWNASSSSAWVHCSSAELEDLPKRLFFMVFLNSALQWMFHDDVSTWCVLFCLPPSIISICQLDVNGCLVGEKQGRKNQIYGRACKNSQDWNTSWFNFVQHLLVIFYIGLLISDSAAATNDGPCGWLRGL